LVIRVTQSDHIQQTCVKYLRTIRFVVLHINSLLHKSNQSDSNSSMKILRKPRIYKIISNKTHSLTAASLLELPRDKQLPVFEPQCFEPTNDSAPVTTCNRIDQSQCRFRIPRVYPKWYDIRNL